MATCSHWATGTNSLLCVPLPIPRSADDRSFEYCPCQMMTAPEGQAMCMPGSEQPATRAVGLEGHRVAAVAAVRHDGRADGAAGRACHIHYDGLAAGSARVAVAVRGVQREAPRLPDGVRAARKGLPQERAPVDRKASHVIDCWGVMKHRYIEWACVVLQPPSQHLQLF